MARRKEEKEEHPKLVWRMTAEAPLGELVDPREADAKKRRPPPSDPDAREHGWLGSSLELLGGVRVSETPMDTLPGELIDEFFQPPKKSR